MKALSEQEILERLQSLEGWQVSNDREQIEKEFRFESFMDGIEFVQNVAQAAEELDHHPDIDIRYTFVRIAVCSHDAAAITEKDFTLAERLEQLD